MKETATAQGRVTTALNVTPGDNTGIHYTLIHEIRNPLHNINLATEVLAHLIREESPAVYLNIIRRNSDRIQKMLTDLLSGRINDRSLETHSVHALIDSVLLMNEDRFLLRKVTVRKNYTANDAGINVNPVDMRIALTNIFINAIEAMPPSNGVLEITTKLMASRFVIIIKDNGCGISKENLQNVFKPYFTTREGGLGLGLSTTLAILNGNHIFVNLRSEAGKGTRFILSYDLSA